VFGVVQIEIAATQDRGEKHRTDGKSDGTALEEAFAALLAGRLRLIFLGLSRPFRPLARAFRWQGSPCLDLRVRRLGVRPDYS